jgi:putative nucleotidyltransferase with HDIG domain
LTADKTEFRERIWRVLERLPPISPAAGTLIASLARRDIEVKAVTAAIEHDPVLAARVLQIANSGSFGRLRAIHSISHAVSLVGRVSLRRYAMSWTLGAVFRRIPVAPTWSMKQFTVHSDAVATLADLLAENLPVQNGDAAYVAGLLHDVGSLIIHTASPETTSQIHFMVRLGIGSVTECERELLALDHAEVSGMAAEKWKMSAAITEAVHFHHRPEDDPAGGRNTIPLSLALNKADRFVDSLGLGLTPGTPDLDAEIAWPGQESGVAKALKAFHAAVELETPKT